MNVEALKEKARHHERREEWQKALELYRKALDEGRQEEQPDVSLLNRVGDLEIRVGNRQAALRSYQEAIDLYVEAELPNNAIAICRKLIRNYPDDPDAFLRMGQIRGQQGFLTDARQNFLTYAEMMQARGDMEEAFRALIEFVDLAPGDVEIRSALAAQLHSHGRTEEAVAQLAAAYAHQKREGDEEGSAATASMIREMDPDAALPELAPEPVGDAGAPAETEEEAHELGGLEHTVLAAPEEPEPEEPAEVEEAAASWPPVEPELEVGTEAVSDEDAEDRAEEAVGDPAGWGGWREEPAGVVSREAEPGDEDGSRFGEIDIDGLALHQDDAEREAPPEEGLDDAEEAEAVALPLWEPEGGIDDVGEDLEEEAEDEPEPLPYMDLGEEDEQEEEDVAIYLREGTEVDVEPAWEEASAETREHRVADEPEGEPWKEVPEPPRPSPAPGDEEAVSALTSRLAEDPEDYDRWLSLGETLLSRGDVDGADEAMEKAHRGFASRGEMERAMHVVRLLLSHHPDDLGRHQLLVEYAYQTNDRTLLVPAFLRLAALLSRRGEADRAEAVYQQVLGVDPENREAKAALGISEEPAAAEPATTEPEETEEEYVDFGSLVLDDEAEKTTRWVVPTEEPSGDEEADFARMLGQFKQKVAETFTGNDTKAHYDLGTAYKEMGLVDDAIAEFQHALRLDPHHLPSFEMLGQCFLENGDPGTAVRTLRRATNTRWEVEDDLLGIYYYLAKALESVGHAEEAREFYEKVFSLDINFRDVTERLRELR